MLLEVLEVAPEVPEVLLELLSLSKGPLGCVHCLLFTFVGSCNINFKRLVLALLKGYRHELLGIRSYLIWAGFGLVWR